MIIQEVELNNFRIYQGRNSIDLSTENDKNIIIVSGKNGYGKTTFLMALAWCLYGRQMEKVDELYQKEISDKGGYTKYISTSLNRAAKARGETNFSVSVTFHGIKLPEVTCNEVRITRSYDINDIKDNIEILIDGYPNGLFSELGSESLKGEEIFIRDYILPLEIAKFFLFDAEKIVSLAEINSPEQRRQLSLAYSEVLGIKKYEELREHLERIQDEYRKQSANAKEKEQFIQLEADISKAKIESQEKEHEIEIIKEEKDAKKFESNQIQEKLIREGNLMTLEELERIRERESALNERLLILQSDLKDSFDLVPFALTGDILFEITNQLEDEANYRNNKYKLDNIDDKTNQILNDLEEERTKTKIAFDNKIWEFYSSQFKSLIKKHFYSDVPEISSNFHVLHDFSDIEMNEFKSLLDNLKSSYKETYKRINTEYSQVRNDLRGIQVRIREAEKNQENSYISELRSKKDKLDTRIRKIEQEIIDLSIAGNNIKNSIKTLEAQKTELAKKIDVSKQNKSKDEEAKFIIQKLKDFIVKFKEQKKQSLESSILKGLNTLMHKKGFITKVLVDINTSGEDIDINLYKSAQGEEMRIDKESLSKGEQQLYATALLNALVDESDIDFPVFIDSPMQKFDVEHSHNIIKYFYPNVSGQVVILPLIVKELTESEYALIKPHVAKTVLIVNRNSDHSEFIKVEPTKLFEVFNSFNNYAN